MDDEYTIHFLTLQLAIEKIPLDRRIKWSVYDNMVVRHEWVTVACFGCAEYDDTGHLRYAAGCKECGYTGKRRQLFPNPYQTKDNRFVVIDQPV